MRRCTAWILYGIGHAVGVVMNLGEGMGRIYPLYNRLMCASADIQGDGPGPWEAPPDSEFDLLPSPPKEQS